MDQVPGSNGGYGNNSMFGHSQQINAYDNPYQAGVDQSSYDASWGVNASQSRAPHVSAPSWSYNASLTSAPPTQANNTAVRSLTNSPALYAQQGFGGYAPPQNFHYRQPQYDPSLVSPHFDQNFAYSKVDYQVPNAGTIAPHALQHDPRASHPTHSPYNRAPYQPNGLVPQRQPKPTPIAYVDQIKLISAISAGKNGGRFSIIDFDELATATGSERMGNFVNIGIEAQNWDVNRAALPAYAPRKSRNELRRIAGSDPKLLAKLSKKTLKRERLPGPRPVQATGKPALSASEAIKYEGDSSSEDESSSDESYYSSDDEAVSPLPVKRPDRPIEATEYDTIKVLWRGKRNNLDSASIRKGLGDFWDIVKTIRDRWKTDLGTLEDAKAKERKNELPLLESRVKDQRDMLEAAFKAALKHGHKRILELMSENTSLLFLCYQFLLDRAKVEDYNSGLPRIILEVITVFTTVDEEKLEKTHLVKVLPKFIKKGDAKTQFYAKRIQTNAVARSKETLIEKAAPKVPARDASAASPPGKRSEPERVAGIKRPASSSTDNMVSKKVATGSLKANGTAAIPKVGNPQKKPSLLGDAQKTAAANTTAVPVKAKQVVAKPSGLFSSLQSAAKRSSVSVASKAPSTAATMAKPKTADKTSTAASATGQNAAPPAIFSFAETMANLNKPQEEKQVAQPQKQTPVETPAEKAKRLRRESRRHLHVTFKMGDELEQVREFHHDPEEELGHDASQVRDLDNKGGEGRMLKQSHQMMAVDDEEESSDEDEPKLLDYVAPTAIDFTTIDKDERDRMYAPFGGGKLEPDSPERKTRERAEADTLQVYYIEASDIPPNPREPADPYNGQNFDKVKPFGAPEGKWMERARKATGGFQQQTPAPPQSVTQPVMQPWSSNAFQPAAPAQATAPSDAISNILASLKQAQAGHAAPQMPPMPAWPPNMAAFPPQPAAVPAGQPDLAAILAQLQGNQLSAPQPGYPYNIAAAAPSMAAYQPATTYENPERKAWREDDGDASGRLRRQNPAQNPNYRTKICKYWQEGRCQKGDSCSYKHSED